MGNLSEIKSILFYLIYLITLMLIIRVIYFAFTILLKNVTLLLVIIYVLFINEMRM